MEIHAALWFENQDSCPLCHVQEPDDGVVQGCAECHALFPHPAGYVDGEAHGPMGANGRDDCAPCHGDGDVRPAGREQSACLDCHPGYPHPEDHGDPASHGPAGVNGGEACFPCHGTGEERPADVEQSACRDCHHDYPHRVTWQQPSIHGAPVLADGLEVCGGCHGAAGEGGALAQACGDCHPLYPHADGWETPEGHGANAQTLGNDSCATLCHGADLGGGDSGTACTDCHPIYPHGDDYRDEHQDEVESYGEVNCLACHDDQPGFPANFSCAEVCHTLP